MLREFVLKEVGERLTIRYPAGKIGKARIFEQ